MSRTARTSLVAFLLIVAAAGGYLVFDAGQRRAQVLADERNLTARLDAMLASLNELALTQRGYFEPGREGGVTGPLFQRVRQLTEELRTHVAAVRTELSAPEAVEQAAVLTAALDAFAATDARVRTNLANDTFFSAAELVFATATSELKTAIDALAALKSIAISSTATQHADLGRRALYATTGVALVWILGLIILIRPPSERVANAGLASTELSTGNSPGTDPPAVPEVEVPSATVAAAEPASPSIDLEAVARVCTAIGGASSATALREILADAASAASASGLILWLGAGEELFPVLGHGYDPRMLSRIGPIGRHADNATAIAWRTVTPQAVAADAGRPGAIVVPLVGAQGCVGVLSAEVAAGSENDPAMRAVITLLAAQLSAIVAAWPEPSVLADDHAVARTGSIAVTL